MAHRTILPSFILLPLFLLPAALMRGQEAQAGVIQSERSSSLEKSSLWLDVPFIAQPNQGCGAASIVMVMQYWSSHDGPTNSPNVEQVFHALHSDSAHGIYTSDMVRYFQQNGYRTFTVAGSAADLEQHLSKGRPLIVALKPGSGLPLHYVVVAGLDPQNHVVLLNDPAQRKLLKEDDARFEREWKAAGHWMLLALPQSAAH